MNTIRIAQIAVAVVLLAAPQVFCGDLATLNWTPDSGIRLSQADGPERHPIAKCVWERPDGQYGMYFYDGDGTSHGDTGLALSSDGMNWTYVGKVRTHGGHGFDNTNAVITSIVALPGGGLRAYCEGMESNQGLAPTSIFYMDTTDPFGEVWSDPGTVLFNGNGSIGQVTTPRVYESANGYTMYFQRGPDIVRVTSSDGISNFSAETVVLSDVGAFDIVDRPEGGLRMFGNVYGTDVIRSFTSDDDGLSWSADGIDILTGASFGVESLYAPVVSDIAGGKMYLTGRPVAGTPVSNIYSATPEPATLGLLALGGLALLRRRRK